MQIKKVHIKCPSKINKNAANVELNFQWVNGFPAMK
jgi:hypothetical protein